MWTKHKEQIIPWLAALGIILFIASIAAFIINNLNEPTCLDLNLHDSVECGDYFGEELPTRVTVEEVEADISLMISEIPDSPFKSEAVYQFDQFKRGKAVDREFLLTTARLIGFEVSDDIPTQDLIDLLANAYIEYSK